MIKCYIYLTMHLDRRLTWQAHVKAKRTQLNIKLKKMYWLIGKKSKLSLQNKIRLYKVFLKPIWAYGLLLWGTTSESNIEIIQRFQSKTLRLMLDAPWYIKNIHIHEDLNITLLKDEINKGSVRYLERLSNHVNPVAICLLDDSNETKRLQRVHTLDLPFRK